MSNRRRGTNESRPVFLLAIAALAVGCDSKPSEPTGTRKTAEGRTTTAPSTTPSTVASAQPTLRLPPAPTGSGDIEDLVAQIPDTDKLPPLCKEWLAKTMACVKKVDAKTAGEMQLAFIPQLDSFTYNSRDKGSWPRIVGACTSELKKLAEQHPECR